MSLRQVTIIMPLYNMGDKAVEALTSVIDQQVDWHVIVVDDASSPPFHMPQQLADNARFTLVRHKTNQGAGAARNTGLAHAKTQWVGFLDADDQLMPNTVEQRLEFAERALEVEGFAADKTLFSCGWIERDDNGQALFERTPRAASHSSQFASGCWWNPGSAMLFHRSVFDRHLGGYDTSFQRLEDFDLGLRFGKMGGRLVIDPIIGASVQPGQRTDIKAIEAACRVMREKHTSLAHEDKASWHNMNAYLHLELAACHWRNRNFIQTISHGLQSLWYCPRLKAHLSPGWDYKQV